MTTSTVLAPIALGVGTPIAGVGICVALVTIAGKAGHKVMTLLGPDPRIRYCAMNPRKCGM